MMSAMTAQSERYNGWKNYETWAVALHLDNDYGTYTMVRERADEIKSEAPDHHNVPSIWTADEAARFELADYLKELAETLTGIGGESEDLRHRGAVATRDRHASRRAVRGRLGRDRVPRPQRVLARTSSRPTPKPPHVP
jgi:hypothetical protein